MADINVLTRALVSMAESRGAGWLEDIRDRAAAAVLEGDQEITILSFEGANATGARRFNSVQLLEIAQAALEQVNGDNVTVVINDYSRKIVET